jgi:hypothetical protein
VEEALATHAAVEEVTAFAVPDAAFGEVVGVAVVYKKRERCQPSHAELVAHGRRSISAFKLPVHVVPVNRIPTTGGAGKVSRNTLHAELGVDLDSPAYRVVKDDEEDDSTDAGDSLSLVRDEAGGLTEVERVRAHVNFFCMVAVRRIGAPCFAPPLERDRYSS